MDYSMLGLPLHHQLLELLKLMFIESLMPSHLLFPSPAFNLSQHQGVFKEISSSYQVFKVSEFQLQHQSFQ